MNPYTFSRPGPSRSSASTARAYRDQHLSRPSIWQDLDRAQVLGGVDERGRAYGHTGCVNALSWAGDGGSLLSGSDDRRVCIWTPSETIPASPTNPHPFSLSTVISTGHRANIFSAKYLPHTGGGSEGDSPKIVTCAGDNLIKVFDVRRLGRVERVDGRGRRGGLGRTIRGGPEDRVELDGESGEGVRVIKCHTDRVKRISTEDNASTFLTVSEDGTVRQHDLRTTHSCPHACPSPLFSTNPAGPPLRSSRFYDSPGSLSLYTLSVSKINPYLFTVAGTAPYAYLLDRRMVGREMENEWGRLKPSSSRLTGAGGEEKVKCVRRFGLRPEITEGHVGQRKGGSRRSFVRHITAVQMSDDVAEDLIVSFSGHSVALFSIHDDPRQLNAKASSSKIPASPSTSRSPSGGPGQITPAKRRRSTGSGESVVIGSVLPSLRRYAGPGSTDSARSKGKGRMQDVPYARAISPSGGEPLFAGMVDAVMAEEAEGEDSLSEAEPGGVDAVGNDPAESERGAHVPGVDGDGSEGKPPDSHTSLFNVGQSTNDSPQTLGPNGVTVSKMELDNPDADGARSEAAEGTRASDLGDDEKPDRGKGQETSDDKATEGDSATDMYDEDDSEDGDVEEQDDDASVMDDDDDDDHDDEDEDEDDFEDNGGLYLDNDQKNELYSDVDVVYQRRNYSGARNVQTVKDVTFLGPRSDKVCSGSDDGNFFVWDKLTGRLDGIWEGDGSIANVIEQHPNLPMLAVSGIDDTVKIFAPLGRSANPSVKRLAEAERIIANNTVSPESRPRTGPTVTRLAFTEHYARLMTQFGGAQGDGDVQDCVSQ